MSGSPLPDQPTTPAERGCTSADVRSHVERIIDGIDGVLWEASWPDLAMGYVSASAERLLGYPASLWEKAPEVLALAVHGEDRQAFADGCRAAVEIGGNHRFRFRMIGVGGREVVVQAIVHPVTDGGDAVAVRGLLVDVTAESRVDDALARADRRWRTLLARSADLALVLSESGELVDATPSLARFAGVARAEDLQGPLIDLVHPDDRVGVIEAFNRASRGPTATTVRIDYRTALADGEWVWVEAIYTNHLDDPTIRGIVCNIRDITARRAAEEALRAAAHTDALTGLANRSGLQAALAGSAEEGALFLLDLDGFKEINDALGHEVGDRVLQEVARRLQQQCSRPGDHVARLAGDEFAVVVADCATEADLQRLARTLVDGFDEPVVIDGIKLRVAATMGAVRRGPGATPGRLLRRADIALERARQQRQEWRAWDDADDESAHRLGLLADLHHAVHNDEIGLAFQPKLDLASGDVVGVEALARWHHAERGAVPPAEFIPLAEHSGLIRPLTARVVDLALAAVEGWREAGLDLTVAVNLSPTTFRDPDLAGGIARALARTGTPASTLVLELTESALAGSDAETTATLVGLHELGVRLSVDDFGTGYSVLSYLKRLPITELKIDREFVTNACTDDRDLAIAASVVELAHRLGMVVVAEGVEDDQTATLMRDVGCDIGQGYGLCRPLPAAALTEWLAARATVRLP